jgi:DNA segregation ATPase FtsK/SpoIIIE-like protein
MKSEKEWINNLRNRMEDYSEPLPEGLWDKLSKELEEPKTPKVIPIWRRWQAAAAVLVLLVSSLTYWFWSSPEADFRNQELAVEVKNTPLPAQTSSLDEQVAEVKHAEPFQKEPVALLANVSSKKSAGEVPEEIVEVAPASVALAEQEAPIESVKKEKAVKQQEVSRSAERSRQVKRSRAADREQMERNARALKNKSDKSSGFSVGVGAGNTPYSSLNTFDGMGSFVARSAYYTSSDLSMSPINNNGLAYSQVLLENAIQAPQTTVKHHIPVTVGLTVAWQFHEDWALETGLNYTLLSSDIHSGSKSYVEETQKLHYIGIPLKLHRSIWKNNWLSVYASAGGVMEKCVSGNLETVTVTNGGNRTSENTSLDVDPLQWSVTAAAGAQVNFTSRFGLYLEPGIAYYFDDHSGVDSRTILDMNGAEKLLGKGDMLFYPQGYSKPARVQGAFVSDKEVSDVVDYLKNQTLGNVYNSYAEDIEEKIKNIGSSGGSSGSGSGGGNDRDEYFEEAARFIIDKDKASIGMLQRVLKIGFNRAARIMDQLCEYGVVGEEEGTKPRKVLMSMEQFEQLLEEI